MQREIPRGGMLGFEDDRVQVSDVVCRAVPQRALLNLRRERGAAVSISALFKERMPAPQIPRGSAADNELERPFADLPLIVEDLLLQAKALAESGAPTGAVGAVLEYAAALREGRG